MIFSSPSLRRRQSDSLNLQHQRRSLSQVKVHVVPTNTKKNDRWSERSFNDWIRERNEQCDDQCPVNILETEDAECLAKWLSLFVIEIRKKDGSCYPPATMLLCQYIHWPSHEKR